MLPVLILLGGIFLGFLLVNNQCLIIRSQQRVAPFSLGKDTITINIYEFNHACNGLLIALMVK